MDEHEVRRVLARLGEFFAVQPASDPGPWHPVTDLLDPAVLGRRVETVGAALSGMAGADVEPRVAASTASLGLFARLLSPALGATLLDLPGPAVDALRWRPGTPGTVPLSATRWTRDALDETLGRLLLPLVDLLADRHRLSRTVLRGNLASAVDGSLRLAARSRPDLAGAAGALRTRLLHHPALADAALPGEPFVRRSCCLYYRLPGGGYCGDCVLAPQHRPRVEADRSPCGHRALG
ncbi:(2Fe-2S)-binding protein [Aeromicrobium halocynthiae]|uniref:(2Fe-2S)-binding protein n=1 Tax=Aeromicrobium halocynthiae TaxID=560557 RepID=A0ABN2VV19_9ACTN